MKVIKNETSEPKSYLIIDSDEDLTNIEPEVEIFAQEWLDENIPGAIAESAGYPGQAKEENRTVFHVQYNIQ